MLCASNLHYRECSAVSRDFGRIIRHHVKHRKANQMLNKLYDEIRDIAFFEGLGTQIFIWVAATIGLNFSARPRSTDLPQRIETQRPPVAPRSTLKDDAKPEPPKRAQFIKQLPHEIRAYLDSIKEPLLRHAAAQSYAGNEIRWPLRYSSARPSFVDPALFCVCAVDRPDGLGNYVHFTVPACEYQEVVRWEEKKRIEVRGRIGEVCGNSFDLEGASMRPREVPRAANAVQVALSV